MAYLEVSAHMKVRRGCLEGFKQQAAELIRITNEQDTRTLRYDWYVSDDGTECEVREAYSGPEGMVEHNTHIVAARTKLFADYADGHFMTFYGETSPLLLDLLKAHSVGYKWFTFFGGLAQPSHTADPARDSIAPPENAVGVL
jgi:quinol monooxygenase YgiN